MNLGVLPRNPSNYGNFARVKNTIHKILSVLSRFRRLGENQPVRDSTVSGSYIESKDELSE